MKQCYQNDDASINTIDVVKSPLCKLSLMVMRKVKNYKRYNKVFFHQTKMYEYDNFKEIAEVFHYFRGPLSLHCQIIERCKIELRSSSYQTCKIDKLYLKCKQGIC